MLFAYHMPDIDFTPADAPRAIFARSYVKDIVAGADGAGIMQNCRSFDRNVVYRCIADGGNCIPPGMIPPD